MISQLICFFVLKFKIVATQNAEKWFKENIDSKTNDNENLDAADKAIEKLSKRYELNEIEKAVLDEFETEFLEGISIPAILTTMRRDNEVRNNTLKMMDNILKTLITLFDESSPLYVLLKRFFDKVNRMFTI